MAGFVLVNGKWTIDKDPGATLDYSWDWSDWLNLTPTPDTIASHLVTLAGSPTAVLESSAEDAGVVTAWISGGAAGEKIAVTCHITTNSVPPREDDRTFYLKVKER